MDPSNFDAAAFWRECERDLAQARKLVMDRAILVKALQQIIVTSNVVDATQ